MGKSGNDAIEVVKTDLEIEEHLDAHKQGWKVQRWGVAFILTLLVLAAAGVFGDGIASKTKKSAGNITVETERFYRFESRMEVKVSATEVGSAGLTLSFPGEYLKNFRVESIQPEPEANTIDGDKVTYSFSGSGKADITMYLIPKSIGNISGDLEVNGQIFMLKHFIYP